MALLKRWVKVPAGFELHFEVSAEDQKSADVASRKLRRRYKDLTGEAP